MERHGNNLFVGGTAVGHLDNAYGAALNQGHGMNCLAAEHEHVEGVSVGGVGAGNEAIVRRIVGGGVKHPVKAEHTGFLVHFVFVFAAVGNFYNRGEVVLFNSLLGNVMPNVHFCSPFAKLRCYILSYFPPLSMNKL